MRNVPLKGLQAKPSSPLRKFFDNHFTKGSKDDINAPMDEVIEEDKQKDTGSDGGVPCYIKNDGYIPNKDKPTKGKTFDPNRDRTGFAV